MFVYGSIFKEKKKLILLNNRNGTVKTPFFWFGFLHSKIYNNIDAHSFTVECAELMNCQLNIDLKEGIKKALGTSESGVKIEIKMP